MVVSTVLDIQDTKGVETELPSGGLSVVGRRPAQVMVTQSGKAHSRRWSGKLTEELVGFLASERGRACLARVCAGMPVTRQATGTVNILWGGKMNGGVVGHETRASVGPGPGETL